MIANTNLKQLFLAMTLIVAMSLASCNKILSSDSGRAQELLETLIIEPGNQEKLAEVTLNDLWSTKNVLPAIHGENTLRYLRARIKQKQDLEYKVSRKTNLSDKRSYVEVEVIESSTGVLRQRKFRYVFRVFFEEQANGNNIITSCKNLN